MIINGTTIAAAIQKEISDQMSSLSGRKPCLAAVLVGEHPPSQIYVNRKTKLCAEVGMASFKKELPVTISQDALIEVISELNADDRVDGILLQLPLPSHINTDQVISYIDPSKDVDGLHPLNVGHLLIGNSHTFAPCTPLGIKEMLLRTGINPAGKQAVILGRSNLVGKPMAALLMQNAPGANATVTIAHSQSNNLKQLCISADILIAAIGRPLFVTSDMVKEGAVVVDVGINKVPADNKAGYKIVGDVDFDEVQKKCSFISPVPGGVGPMTIAMLLQNTLQSYKQRKKT